MPIINPNDVEVGRFYLFNYRDKAKTLIGRVVDKNDLSIVISNVFGEKDSSKIITLPIDRYVDGYPNTITYELNRFHMSGIQDADLNKTYKDLVSQRDAFLILHPQTEMTNGNRNHKLLNLLETEIIKFDDEIRRREADREVGIEAEGGRRRSNRKRRSYRKRRSSYRKRRT